MNHRDFCYWISGVLECDEGGGLTGDMCCEIRTRLNALLDQKSPTCQTIAPHTVTQLDPLRFKTSKDCVSTLGGQS